MVTILDFLNGNVKMTKKELTNARWEIISGYYNRIVMNKLTLEDVLQTLEKDIEYLRMEDLSIEVDEIINKEQKVPIFGTNRKKSKQEIIDYVNEWTWYVGIKGNNPERASEGMQTPEEYFKDVDL